VIEGLVIITSILLAFGIDAWWSERQDRADERASLELLVRDLESTIERLDEFELISLSAARAGTEAYAAMASPGPIDAEEISPRLAAVGMRRTLSIPSAAYTELLSTGSLRVIEDRVLRDRIVRFYEEARRTEDIVASNNRTVLDGSVARTFSERGLVGQMVQPSSGVSTDALLRSNARIAEWLGEDFEHPRDRVLTLGRTSEEWSAVRTVAFQAARFHSSNAQNTRELGESAAQLSEQALGYLATR
jgi:hypothetical protein